MIIAACRWFYSAICTIGVLYKWITNVGQIPWCHFSIDIYLLDVTFLFKSGTVDSHIPGLFWWKQAPMQQKLLPETNVPIYPKYITAIVLYAAFLHDRSLIWRRIRFTRSCHSCRVVQSICGVISNRSRRNQQNGNWRSETQSRFLVFAARRITIAIGTALMRAVAISTLSH